MPGVEIKKVKAEDDGMRLNRWFMKYYPNLTLGRLQKLLRTKQIKVDGKRAETSLKLAAGSEVRVPPMDEQPETGANRSEISRRDAEFILSLVIYKDDNIIVLNKPSGLAVQGGGLSHTYTALSITSTGFQVFSQDEARTNTSGEGYRYIAFL